MIRGGDVLGRRLPRGDLGSGVAGLFMLWSAVSLAPTLLGASFLAGSILLGWGAFNLAEGVLDHHILGIHHVKPGPHQLAWDLVLVGTWIIQSARRVVPETLHNPTEIIHEKPDR